MNISKTGYWEGKTAHIHHAHSKPLEQWIINFFNNKVVEDKRKAYRIYDLGCGLGNYIKALNDSGYKSVIGMEGDPPLHKVASMWKWDITQPIRGITKGSVICLEVLEHIPEELCDVVIKNIEHLCDSYLILSWAIPNQPGVGHVNCISNRDAIIEFEKKGFYFMEPETLDARSVIDETTPWFKDTLLIFKKVKQ